MKAHCDQSNEPQTPAEFDVMSLTLPTSVKKNVSRLCII